MKIESAQRFHRDTVSRVDIDAVFSPDADQDRGEFVVLKDGSGGFVQAAGEGGGPFAVEWKSADGHYYSAGRRMTREQARDTFHAFLQQAGDIRNFADWKPFRRQWREQLVGGLFFAGAFLCWGMATLVGPFNGWIESRVVLLGLKIAAGGLFVAGAAYFICKDRRTRRGTE